MASGAQQVTGGGIGAYLEKAPLAALALGISSGFPYAMIGATLTTRLAQANITKSTITAFSLAFLVYNFKPLWAWVVDGVRLPLIGRLGQRVSWLLVAGALVMAAVANLALVDPGADIMRAAIAAILVGAAGATFDIVIDAYRIEILEPPAIGRRIGDEPVRLADRFRRCGRDRAGNRGARRLAGGVSRLRAARAAGDADRADRRRTRPASRHRGAPQPGRTRSVDLGDRSSSSSNARAPGSCWRSS